MSLKLLQSLLTTLVGHGDRDAVFAELQSFGVHSKWAFVSVDVSGLYDLPVVPGICGQWRRYRVALIVVLGLQMMVWTVPQAHAYATYGV